MIRAGNFIVIIEKKIERIVPVPPDLSQHQLEFDIGVDVTKPLSWECYLRVTRGSGVIQGHMVWVYKVRLCIFPVVAIVSWGIGGLCLFSQVVMRNITFPTYFIISYLILYIIWIYLLVRIARVFSDVTKR